MHRLDAVLHKPSTGLCTTSQPLAEPGFAANYPRRLARQGGSAPMFVGDDKAMSDVYLHVGPVKTGSTYLQSILWNSPDALREQGVLLPADHPNEFFLAANDVQGGRPSMPSS
jgi:hypothetical protein